MHWGLQISLPSKQGGPGCLTGSRVAWGLLVVTGEQSHTPELFSPNSGQLRFWNPDDLNASPGASLPTPEWIEEKLQEVCEHLGITRDGHLNRKKLVSICEQFGLQNVSGEVSAVELGLPEGWLAPRGVLGVGAAPDACLVAHRFLLITKHKCRLTARCFPRGLLALNHREAALGRGSCPAP